MRCEHETFEIHIPVIQRGIEMRWRPEVLISRYPHAFEAWIKGNKENGPQVEISLTFDQYEAEEGRAVFSIASVTLPGYSHDGGQLAASYVGTDDSCHVFRFGPRFGEPDNGGFY